MTIHLGKIVEYVTFRNSFISGYPRSSVEDVTGALNNLDQKDYGKSSTLPVLAIFRQKDVNLHLQSVRQ